MYLLFNVSNSKLVTTCRNLQKATLVSAASLTLLKLDKNETSHQADPPQLPTCHIESESVLETRHLGVMGDQSCQKMYFARFLQPKSICRYMLC